MRATPLAQREGRSLDQRGRPWAAVAEQQERLCSECCRTPERTKREACKIGGNVHGWRADSGRRKKEEAGGEEDESCSFARGADIGPGGFFGGYGRSSDPGGSPRCPRDGRGH